MVFGRKQKLLLNLQIMPHIKVLSTFQDYYELLNKRLQYLHRLIQDFKATRLAMIDKKVYIITPFTSQFHPASRKVMIKCLWSVVIYKIMLI